MSDFTKTHTYSSLSRPQKLSVETVKSYLDYFERALDSKNRLTIPAELRHEFEGGEVVITRGFGQYLHIYKQPSRTQYPN